MTIRIGTLGIELQWRTIRYRGRRFGRSYLAAVDGAWLVGLGTVGVALAMLGGAL